MGEYARFGEWGLAFLPVLDQATLPRHPGRGFAGRRRRSADRLDVRGSVIRLRHESAVRARLVATRSWAGRPRDTATTQRLCTTATRRRAAAASPRDVLTQMVTDGLFRCGGLRVAAARAVSRPVYAYQFEVTSPLAGRGTWRDPLHGTPIHLCQHRADGVLRRSSRESRPRSSIVPPAPCTMPGLVSSAMAIPTQGAPGPGGPTGPMTPRSWSSGMTTFGS